MSKIQLLDNMPVSRKR